MIFPSQIAVGMVYHPKINFAKPCLPVGRLKKKASVQVEVIHLNRHSLHMHLVHSGLSCACNRIVWYKGCVQVTSKTFKNRKINAVTCFKIHSKVIPRRDCNKSVCVLMQFNFCI